MIVAMAKVLIVGPKDLQSAVIKALQGLGRMHVSGAGKSVQPATLNSADQARKQQLEQLNAEIDQLLALLNFRGKAAKPQSPDWDGLQALIAGNSEKVKALARQRMELEDELNLVLSYRSAYEALAPLMARLEGSHRLKAFGFILKGGDEKAVTALSLQLKKATEGRCEVYSHPLPDGRTATLVAYHSSDTERIRSFFAKVQISELKLPSAMESMPMPKVVSQLKSKAAELPKQISGIKQQLSDLAAEAGPRALWYKRSIEDELERFRAAHQAAHSQLTFILQGYLPQPELETLRSKIKDQFGDKVTVQVIEINHHDAPNVPVVLKNNPIVRPFELMLSIFNPPQYGTVDPTPFIAFFFPMYFGFIIGDIGYGALMLMASGLLWWKFRNNALARSLLTIFAICAVWTTLFGVVFGELFGDFGEHKHWIKPMSENLNRLSSESIMTLFKLSLVIGFIQVYIGYGIMLYTGIKHRNSHHILEAIFFALGVLSVFGIFFTIMVKVLPHSLMWPSVIGASISAVVLGILAGVAGPIEIFGNVGNILSFARLFAIGLSAAYLAYAANLIGRTIGGITGFFVAALVIHPIFFMLGLISPIMQPFRLQVVEFFTKFKYHDYSGKKYKPLKTLGGD